MPLIAAFEGLIFRYSSKPNSSIEGNFAITQDQPYLIINQVSRPDHLLRQCIFYQCVARLFPKVCHDHQSESLLHVAGVLRPMECA